MQLRYNFAAHHRRQVSAAVSIYYPGMHAMAWQPKVEDGTSLHQRKANDIMRNLHIRLVILALYVASHRHVRSLLLRASFCFPIFGPAVHNLDALA